LISSLLPIVSFFFLKEKKSGLWVIFFYLIYSLFSDLFLNHIYDKIAPFFGFRMFTIVEYSAVTYYFYQILRNTTVRQIVPVISLLFVGYCIYDLISSKFSHFDSIPVAIEAILIIGFCIIVLFEKIKRTDTLFIYSTSDFWIAVSFLIYFAGTFFLYIYAQNYMNNEKFLNNYNLINSSFVTLRNILIAIAFLIKPKVENYPIIPSK